MKNIVGYWYLLEAVWLINWIEPSSYFFFGLSLKFLQLDCGLRTDYSWSTSAQSAIVRHLTVKTLGTEQV